MSHFVYIVVCSDKTFYTGYTTNVNERLDKHNTGKGAKYTRGRQPVFIVWWKECSSKSEALKLECKIKKMSRREKKALTGVVL